MAEEDTSLFTGVEDAYVNAYEKFKPFDFSEEDVYEQIRIADSPEEASSNIAENIVGAMTNAYNLPEVTLESLKNGTSPFYKYLREKSADRDSSGNIIEKDSLDPKGFGTDENILNFFSNLNFKDNPALQGLFNQIGPSAAFSLAFTTSAQQIFRRAPGTPFQKIIAAGLGSIPLGFLASNATEYVQEKIFNPIEFNLLNTKIKMFGEEEPTMPSERARYLSGKAFADFVSFMPMPWMVKSGTKMGAAKVLTHLRDRAKLIEGSKVTYKAPQKKGFFQTSKPVPLGKDFETYMKTGKFPMTRRFSSFIDNLLTGGVEFAKKRPLPYIITETGAGLGASMGVEFAEEKFPGQAFPRFGSEVSGAVSGAISAQPIFPVTRILAGSLKSLYNLVSKGSFTEKPFLETLKGFADKKKGTVTTFRQRQGVKSFRSFLEKYGVDPDKFVKNLESSFMGMDKKFLDEFNLDLSSLEELSKKSVGFKSGEPFAILYESSLMSNFDNLGPRRAEMFKAAENAVLNVLKILRGSGNDEALIIAAQMEKELLQNKISTDLESAVSKSLKAFQDLRGGQTGGEQYNQELSTVLFNTLNNQLKLARKTEKEFYEKVNDFEIDGTFGKDSDNTPSFISSFQNKEVMPQDPDILKKYINLPGFKDAFILVKRLKNQLGIEDAPAGSENVQISPSNLEAEMQDLVKSFDTTVLGQQKNRLSTEIENISNRILDYKDDVDFAQKALSYLKGNAPTKIDTARKGFTRDQIASFKKSFDDQTKVHKGALKYYETYLKQAKLNQPKAEEIGENLAPVTYQTLVDFRSEIIEEAGKYYAQNPNSKHGRRLSLLAQSIRQDLRTLEEDVNAGSALKLANNYSFALNEVFTRSTMGKSVKVVDKTGALTTPPELLFQKVKALDDPTAFRYKELENIHNFLVKNEIIEDTAFKDTPTYNNILYHLVRNNKLLNSLISEKEVVTSSGEKTILEQLNTKSAKNLLKNPNSKEILKFFPDLEKDLKNAITAQSLVDITLDADGKFLKSLNEQGALSKILEYDDPAAYIAELLRSKEPISNLTRSFSEVKSFIKNNPKSDALTFTKNIATIDGKSKKVKAFLNEDNIFNGYKEAILNHVLTSSGMNQGGKFNPQKAYSLLFEPMKGVGGRRRTSLSTWMRGKNLITDKQLNLFKESLISMSKLDIQMKGGNIDLSEFNAFQHFAFGALGSVLGTGTQRAMGKIIPGMEGGAGPASIIAAGQGANFARNLFMAVPESLRQSAMIEVMNNPQLFLQLNKELKEGAALNYFGTILNLFKKASLIGGSVTLKQLMPIVKTDEEEGAPPFSEFIKQKLKIQKGPNDDLTASVEPSIQEGIPTTQVASRQPFLSGLKIAPAGGGISSTASAPTNRAQYASLFPNDIVSGMIPTATMADGGEVQYMYTGGTAGDEQSMGLESDIAGQQNVQGGLDPYGTGSDNSTDVQKALYNPAGIQKGRKTDYIKKMLSMGLANKLQKDKSGQITGIYSNRAPNFMEQMQMDPIGTALKTIVPGAGILELVGGYLNPNREVYTGYNPKITTEENMNDGNEYNPLIRIANQKLQPAPRKTAASLFSQNPDQYTLNVSGINSLRNR